MAILGNTRSAVQEKFCIFTIGIGNDVDYRLLERMALENCGMMRRINEEADASAMLKGYGFDMTPYRLQLIFTGQ